MMLSRILIVVCVLVMTLAACSGSGTPTVGEAKDFNTICDKANDGKRVAVEGFLRFPKSFKGNDSVVLRLYQADDFKGNIIGVQTKFGTAANQIETVKDQFADTDLKVHLASGQVSTFGAKVKVSGNVYFPIVAQEFPCALENPLVEAAN